MSNPIRYLKEKIIDRLTLKDKDDVKKLTVLAHDREALLIALGYEISKGKDPLEIRSLLDTWLTLRIAIEGRARKDIKEVYAQRPFYEIRTGQQVIATSPIPAPELEQQPRTRRRRWL